MKKNIIEILNILCFVFSTVLAITGAFLGNGILITISLFIYGIKFLITFVDELNKLGESK